MSWRCRNGCRTNGRPTIHANRRECPKYEPPATRAVPQAAPIPDPPPSQDEVSKPPTPEPKPAPKAEESGVSGVLSWIRKKAGTVASPEVPTAAQSYLLDGDDVVGFWQLVFSLLEMGLNLFLKFMGAKELPEDLMDLKKSRASQLLISRNMVHTTSQLFISAGVKTKVEAQALIGEGEGILAFGHIFVGVAWHLIEEVPKSPKWREWFGEKDQGAIAAARPEGAPGKAWWDPLGVFSRKAESPKAAEPNVVRPTTPMPAQPAAAPA